MVDGQWLLGRGCTVVDGPGPWVDRGANCRGYGVRACLTGRAEDCREVLLGLDDGSVGLDVVTVGAADCLLGVTAEGQAPSSAGSIRWPHVDEERWQVLVGHSSSLGVAVWPLALARVRAKCCL